MIVDGLIRYYSLTNFCLTSMNYNVIIDRSLEINNCVRLTRCAQPTQNEEGRWNHWRLRLLLRCNLPKHSKKALCVNYARCSRALRHLQMVLYYVIALKKANHVCTCKWRIRVQNIRTSEYICNPKPTIWYNWKYNFEMKPDWELLALANGSATTSPRATSKRGSWWTARLQILMLTRNPILWRQIPTATGTGSRTRLSPFDAICSTVVFGKECTKGRITCLGADHPDNKYSGRNHG